MKHMKKFTIIILALIMMIGFYQAANAVELTFDIDFWGGDTTLAQGTLDTGTTIDLLPSQSVNVDLYFSVDAPVSSGAFDSPFNPAQLQGSNFSLNAGEMDMGSGIDNGNGSVFADFLYLMNEPQGPLLDLVSFEYQCIAPGLDEIWLNDLDPVLSGWVSGGVSLDDQLGVQLASINNIGDDDHDVPIPGTFLLLLSGLIGMAGVTRKREIS